MEKVFYYVLPSVLGGLFWWGADRLLPEGSLAGWVAVAVAVAGMWGSLAVYAKGQQWIDASFIRGAIIGMAIVVPTIFGAKFLDSAIKQDRAEKSSSVSEVEGSGHSGLKTIETQRRQGLVLPVKLSIPPLPSPHEDGRFSLIVTLPEEISIEQPEIDIRNIGERELFLKIVSLSYELDGIELAESSFNEFSLRPKSTQIISAKYPVNLNFDEDGFNRALISIDIYYAFEAHQDADRYEYSHNLNVLFLCELTSDGADCQSIDNDDRVRRR